MKVQFEVGQRDVLMRLVGVKDEVPWSVLDGLDGARVVVDVVGSVVVVGTNVLRIVDDVTDAAQRERAVALATDIIQKGTVTVNGTTFTGCVVDVVEMGNVVNMPSGVRW